MNLQDGFELLATASDGIARLRELILSFAVRGKLVTQDPNEEAASELLRQIHREGDRLIRQRKIKREMPLPGITDEEKPYDLPDTWEWIRLNDLLPEFQNGASSRGDKDGGVPTTVLRLADIKNGRICLDDTREISIAARDVDKYNLATGDILAIRVNGSADLVGRFILNDSKLDAIYCDHFIRIRVNGSRILPSYLATIGDSGLVRNAIASLFVTTAGQKTVNQGHIGLLVIPLPPLAEQHRIVAKVDELMRLCDQLETHGRIEAEQHARLTTTLFDVLATSESPQALAENWSRIAAHFDLLLDRPAAVDALERTILQLAVNGQLVPQDPNDEPASKILKQLREESSSDSGPKASRAGRMPTDAEEEAFPAPLGWEWTSFESVVESLNGYAFKSEWFRAQGVRLVRNTNVSHGCIDWDQVACVDADTAAEFERFALEAGDIVLSLDRPIISSGLKYAEIKAADLPCLLLQRVAKLTPRADSVTRPFLKMWLTSPYFTDLLDPGRSNGVPHISTKQIGAILFALPPAAEQHRIVARVEELRRLCADLRAHLTARQTCHSRFAEAIVAQAGSVTLENRNDLAAAA